MQFDFCVVCKACKSETRFILSPDNPEKFKYAMQCSVCGHPATHQDVEKFLHLTDTLATVNKRNSTAKILKILIHDP